MFNITYDFLKMCIKTTQRHHMSLPRLTYSKTSVTSGWLGFEETGTNTLSVEMQNDRTSTMGNSAVPSTISDPCLLIKQPHF